MNVIDNNTKERVQSICDKFLEEKSNLYDSKLKDGGGFYNKDNFYDWKENTFIINFLSISQDDFLNFYKTDTNFFEKLGEELKELINPIIKIENVYVEDDCPIIYFNIKNK